MPFNVQTGNYYQRSYTEALIQKAIFNNKNYHNAKRHDYITISGQELTLRFWHTDILKFNFETNILTLNNGGYLTPTTKDRINRALNVLHQNCGFAHYSVFQDHGIWYVSLNHNWNKAEGIIFFNGIEIDVINNQVLVPPNPFKAAKLKTKLVREYINKVKDLLKSGKFPKETSGDCFDCQTIKVNVETGQIVMPSDYHLCLHLVEQYVMGSLLYNALKERNGESARMLYYNLLEYGEKAVGFWLVEHVLRNYFKRHVDANHLLKEYENYRKDN